MLRAASLMTLVAIISLFLATTPSAAQETTEQPGWEEFTNDWICYRFGGFSIKRIQPDKEVYEQYYADGTLRFRHESKLTISRRAGINFYEKTESKQLYPENDAPQLYDYVGTYKIMNGVFFEFNRGIFAETNQNPGFFVFRPTSHPVETLFAAAREGNLEQIQKSLDEGVNIEAATPGSFSALSFAASAGQLDALRFLVEKGAGISRKSGGFGTTAIVQAAAYGHTEACELLLSLGSQIDESHNFRMTPLHETAFHGRSETMEFLISQGADLNAKNNAGQTPLHVAVIRSVDNQGKFRTEQMECLKILVKNNADQTVKSNAGLTALDLAKQRQKEILVDILNQ